MSLLEREQTLTPSKAEQIAQTLVAWFAVHKRDLPWRGASPYAVWVSEIMLQQTQVVTVIPFFLRFMERFPTVEALAETPIEEVLKYWAGLGYYARARNLHRAAQKVVLEYGGKIPATPEEIEKLPGIGRYTAGAVLSIAYGVPRPLVDANVIRVLSRLFGIEGDPKSSANQALLWELAERLVPQKNPGDFNQAMMELGALVCQPAEPKCGACPLYSLCVAGHLPDPSLLPEIPQGRATVTLVHSSALIRNEGGEFLLVQRPLEGLWGGLWEFPRVTCVQGETPQEGAERAGREVVGLPLKVGARVGKVKHAVTHHKITLYGFLAEPKHTHIDLAEGLARDMRWVTPERLIEFALSSPQSLLRNALESFLVREVRGLPQPTLDFGAGEP
jgi:A/G-specific adenine glycosylase